MFLISDVIANNLVIFIECKASTNDSTFWVTFFGSITTGSPFNRGPNISEIESTKVKVVWKMLHVLCALPSAVLARGLLRVCYRKYNLVQRIQNQFYLKYAHIFITIRKLPPLPFQSIDSSCVKYSSTFGSTSTA